MLLDSKVSNVPQGLNREAAYKGVVRSQERCQDNATSSNNEEQKSAPPSEQLLPCSGLLVCLNVCPRVCHVSRKPLTLNSPFSSKAIPECFFEIH